MKTRAGRLGSERARELAAAGLAAVVIAVVAIAAFALATARSIDDGFITLSYARHLAVHGAFYWNAQDGPIDGFTSFLDVVIKAVALVFRPRDPVWAGFVVTLFYQVAAAWLATAIAFRAAWRRGGSGFGFAVAAIAALAAAFSPAMAEGAAFLLEAPLWVAVVLLGVIAVDRKRPPRWFAAAVMVLLPLVRPEGLLVAPVLLAVAQREHPVPASRRSLVLSWVVLGVLVGGYETWRRWYFGSWVPNTYYAKSSASRWNEIMDGWAYVSAQWHQAAGFLALATLAISAPVALFASWADPLARVRFRLLAAIALTVTAVTIVDGGDCYAGARFLAVPFVIAPLLLATAASGLYRPGRHIASGVLAALAISQFWPLVHVDGREKITNTFRSWPMRLAHFDCDQTFAAALRNGLPPGSAVAESDYERLKLFADGFRVVDLHGLNDRTIAHEVRSGHVLYGKYRPENGVQADAAVWIWGFVIVTDTPMASVPLEHLLDHWATEVAYVGYTDPVEVAAGETAGRILARYVPASLPACGQYFNVLARDDAAGGLAAAGFTIGTKREQTWPSAEHAGLDRKVK